MMLPDGWVIQPLAEVAQIAMGQSPDSKYYSEEEVGLPFLQGCSEFGGRYPKHAIYCSHSKRIGCAGSILLSVRAPVGRLNIANRDYVIGRGLAALKGTRVTQDFLEHFLIFQEPKFKLVSQGSTFEAINSSELKQWPILRPKDKAEQSKIAEVLSTVDRAIEETEALIAKQQRIKTGLMQDLLTRGIDEHGNLRSETTHEFKDSPLGRIPVEWECKELSQVLVRRPRNGLYKPGSLIGRGTLLVGQTSITRDRRLDFSICRRAVVSPSEIETFGLAHGDILVTRVFATVDGVGQPVLVDSPPDTAVYESNMLLLRPAASIINSLLLFTWLRSAATRRRVRCSVNASNQVSVNQMVLNSLPVPVPSISEQKRISQALGQIDATVQCTDVSLQKLRLLKAGLMKDLLTGDRRVTALLGSPEQAVGK